MVSVLRACLVAASFLWLVVVCISTGVDHGTHAVEVSGTVAQPQGDAPVTADSSVQPVDEDKVGTPEQKNTKKPRKSVKTKTKKSKKNKKKNKKRKKGKKKRSKKKGSAAQKLTGKGTKQMPAGAMKAKADAHDAAMPMFMCTACERAADSVSNALSRRLLAGDTWSIETDNLLWDDIRGTCMNPKLFPRSSRILHEACVKFFNKYTDAIFERLEQHLTPSSDLYEEDWPAHEFCEQVGACGGNSGLRSIDFDLAESRMKGEL